MGILAAALRPTRVDLGGLSRARAQRPLVGSVRAASRGDPASARRRARIPGSRLRVAAVGRLRPGWLQQYVRTDDAIAVSGADDSGETPVGIDRNGRRELRGGNGPPVPRTLRLH